MQQAHDCNQMPESPECVSKQIHSGILRTAQPAAFFRALRRQAVDLLARRVEPASMAHAPTYRPTSRALWILAMLFVNAPFTNGSLLQAMPISTARRPA